MKRVALYSLIALVATANSARAFESPSGNIVFLDECPGDVLEKDPAATKRDEVGLLAPLLTPLITGAISSGIKVAGARLKEAAQEKQVDVIHAGDYFYRPIGTEKVSADDIFAINEIELRSHCVLIATRGSVQTKGGLRDLAQSYHAAKINVTGSEGRRAFKEWTDNAEALEKALNAAGYTDISKPGMTLVADIELGTAAGVARLVPRFIVLDHSIREKKVDTRPRDMTLEISLQAAGAEAAFAKATMKFEDLKIRAPHRRISLTSGTMAPDSPATAQLVTTSPWFVLPALDADSKARAEAAASADKEMKLALTAASLAGAEAQAAGADVPMGNDHRPECPGPKETKDLKLEAARNLLVASVAAKKNEQLIARHTKLVAFFEACEKYHNAVATKQTKRFRRAKADGTAAETLLAFDAYVNVKEFRDRPAAQFFGDLLSDETTRTGLTTALVGELDPATRAAKSADKEAADLKARTEFETALVAAETAIAAYANAKEEEKAAKLIDLESKKRAANRLAESIGVPMPYPSSGTWLTISG